MMNPINQQTSHNLTQVLYDILRKMETCISEQEDIILEEREAMKIFDAQTLSELVERRARSQSTLDELESRCQRIVGLSQSNQNMEQLIDYYAHEDADQLHDIRIRLVRRMQTLEHDHVENHIRLRAAWNVTTSILQQIGAVESHQTYTNTSYASQQAIR